MPRNQITIDHSAVMLTHISGGEVVHHEGNVYFVSRVTNSGSSDTPKFILVNLADAYPFSSTPVNSTEMLAKIKKYNMTLVTDPVTITPPTNV